ncbi:YcdB/YcdC domain-containing protein [Clostridium tetanomorphum]|uniref:SLH domain-containing protein n=1 Tax=Clostridium tetanomorphum TaxID=1553 RepID=A0A923J0E3_CLOTT|nr:YcdB/YcdC domain-containing protein [Clostridium tetanomorphum]MBC2397977.1 hypothetical protein [Clostridium tetanomorphum]NRZ98952.1 hypothetical protein [Clostridium tetanomorphum]
MKSKNLVSLVLGVALIFTNYSLVFAKDINTIPNKTNTNIAAMEKKAKVSKEEAKNISKKALKEYFNVNVDEKQYKCSVEFSQSSEEGNFSWLIYWKKDNSNNDMQVFVDASNGKITRASKRQYGQDETSNISKITEEEGRKKAEDFLKKINSKEFKETKYVRSNTNYINRSSDNIYRYNYVRYINGVKFDQNLLTVEVDGVNGDVVTYHINWDDNIKVPSVDGIISANKAEETMKKDLNMDLLYTDYTDKYEENRSKTKLVYDAKFANGSVLDAKSGEFISNNWGKKVEKDLTDKEKKDYLNNIKINKPLDKEISKDRAIELAKKEIKQLYGEGYEINNIRYNENKDNVFGAKNTWSMDFQKDKDKNKGYNGGQITIDALTENIVNLYKSSPQDENSQAKITWEQAYNKAIESIVKYAPEKLKDINTKQVDYINDANIYDKRYHFNFLRIVNGINYDYDYIAVAIDAVKEELGEFSIKWNEQAKFSEPKNLIGKEEVKNVLFNKYKPELNYLKINKNKDDSKKPEYEMKLVYMWHNYVSRYSAPQIRVDAFSGKELNEMGEEIDANIDKFMERIKGNPYEKELNILAYNGIMDTVNFEANKEITQMDFIKMLVNAKGYRPYLLNGAADLRFESSTAKNSTDYKYLQLGVLYGIVPNKEGKFDINAKVTREDMAKTLVKFLGYEKLAQSKDVFTLKISDLKEIKSENLGYMSIAKGLGILEVKDNKIRPKANATWTDLSIAIYRVLDNIRRI